MQAQRNTCVIKVGIEARGPLERSDIELVRIFKGDFRFVRDRLGHGTCPFVDPAGWIDAGRLGDNDLDQRIAGQGNQS
jgi:hypothetical protein